MSEFSARPFAVGSLFGIRSFRVTSSGVLTGVSAQRPWRAGINEAECARPANPFGALVYTSSSITASMELLTWSMESFSARASGRVFLKKRPKARPQAPTPTTTTKHDAGTLRCTCGFYAYSDLGYNPHHLPGNMLGIIEGFGIATVGNRGFRCSKARIRALIVNDFEQGFALAKVMPNYPGVPAFPSVDAALAEFPLTPAPDDLPGPRHLARRSGNSITYYLAVNDQTSRAFQRLARHLDSSKPSDETPRQHALRARRSRNTGPADPHGLDGRYRRKS